MASVVGAAVLASQWGEISLLQRIQSQKPPHPGGDHATYFPFSAQTSPRRSGNPTHSLSISLTKSVYRPGDQLTGSLLVCPRSSVDGEFMKIRRVDMRVYCEARTMFWNYALPRDGPEEVLKEVYDDLDLVPEDAVPDNPSPLDEDGPAAAVLDQSPVDANRRSSLALPRAGVFRGSSPGPLATRHGGPNASAPPVSGGGRSGPVGDLKPAHEWHRIFADRQTLEVASPERNPEGYLEVPIDSATWPFLVHLPTRSRHVSECSWFRGAPRDLQHVQRPLPGTLRDNRNGSVEWIVEAVVTLYDGGEEEERLQLDERGMLKPSRTHLIARQVFELIPAPPAGRGPASGHMKLPKGFSDDPLARVHGAVLARPDGAFDPMSGRLVGREGQITAALPPLPPWIPGGDAGWRRFARTHRIETALMRRKIGRLRFEIALPKEEFISKARKAYPCRAWVMWEGRNQNRDKAGRKKEVWVEGFEVMIFRRTLTRGGADARAHQIVEPLRHAFFPAKRFLAPGVANQFSWSVDLQSTETTPPPKPDWIIQSPECSRSTPLASIHPSVRLPNIERDLVFQTYIRFASEHPHQPGEVEVQAIQSISLVRVALHVLEEEQEQLPAFQDAVGYRPRPPLYMSEKPEWEEDSRGTGDGDVTPRAERSRAPSYRTQASRASQED